MKKEQELFLDILRHAIHGDLPEPKEEIRQNLGRILRLAGIHMVYPLAADALYGMFPDAMDSYTEHAVQQAVEQAERTAGFIVLYRRMKSAGLCPLVMKGIVCRNLYPEPELRPSVDEDLLIIPDDIRRYHSFLMGEGFAPADPEVSLETAAEISYTHPNQHIYLEVHKYLFPPKDERYGELNALFADWEEQTEVRVYGTELKSLGYTDHFLYMLCHAYKHFIYSGIGIRQFCDMALFAENYGASIDWEKLFEKCRQKHLDLFLKAVLKICAGHLGMDEQKAGYQTVFTVQDTDEMPMLLDVLSGGIYGAQDENRLHSANITLTAVSGKKSRREKNWLTGSLFPSYPYMAHAYPYLKKRPYLLPVAWMQRIGRYLMRSRKSVDPGKTVEIGKQRIELLKKYNLL